MLILIISVIISLPGVLTRWVFLERPIGKLLALGVVAPIWLILVIMYEASGGEGPKAFISLGCVLMYWAFVAPLKKGQDKKWNPHDQDRLLRQAASLMFRAAPRESQRYYLRKVAGLKETDAALDRLLDADVLKRSR